MSQESNLSKGNYSMSTTIAEPESQNTTSPSQRLKATMAAARVSVHWFGVRKALTSQQTAQAADTFGAENRFLSAAKKLLDTTHPAFKAVTSVRSRLMSYWKGVSLPYPEPGVRLIRRDKVQEFDAQMRQFQTDLEEAVSALDRHYGDLRQTARAKLGGLYNPADYPEFLVGLFEIEFDFPSVQPPDYLQQLNPELYERECERVQQRFSEAIGLAEDAFIGELSTLVSHLTERLAGSDDGKQKIFRNSAIENLTEFFARFRQLNVKSNEQLDSLVEDAQRIIQGVEPQGLRNNAGLRQQVTTELSKVQSVLDGLLVDRPRRNILRRAKQEGAI
jgi:hypothetical protein